MALTTVPASLSATALTLTTAAQPNITSVGTLTGLTVSGNIAGTLTTAAQTNITSVGTLSALTVTGTLTGSDVLLVDSGTTERSIRIQNSAATAYIGVEGSSANRFVGSAANNMFLGTTTADGIQFATNNNVRVVIDSSGNVGIGVSPAVKFNVDVGAPSSSDQTLGLFQSQTTRQVGFVWDDSQSTLGVATITAHDLVFHTGGNSSERMRIDTSGNVNIGAKDYHTHQASVDSLQIGYAFNLYEDSYNTGTDNYAIWANNAYYTSGGNKYMRNDEASRIMQSNGNLTFQNAAAGTAGNAITFVDSFIVNSSGNVGIGTGSPSAAVPLTAFYSATSQFHIGGAQAGISNNVYYNGSAYTNRNTSAGGALLQLGTDGSFAFRRATSGSSPTLNYSMYIDANGKVGIGDTTPQALLDVGGGYGGNTTVATFAHATDAYIEIENMTTQNGAGIILTNAGTKKWTIQKDTSSHGLYIQDGSTNANMTFLQGGYVGIGENIPAYPLHVDGTNISSGGGLANLCLVDRTAYNGTNPGAGITFRGEYTSGGNTTNFATIQGIKENTTSGNYATALRFTTRAHNGNLTEKMRISSYGSIGISNTQLQKIDKARVFVGGVLANEGRHGNGKIGESGFVSVSTSWSFHSSGSTTGGYYTIRFTVPNTTGSAGNGYGSFNVFMQVSGYSGPHCTANFGGYQNQGIYGGRANIIDSASNWTASIGANGSHGFYVQLTCGTAMTHPAAQILVSHGGSSDTASIQNLNDCTWTWS